MANTPDTINNAAAAGAAPNMPPAGNPSIPDPSTVGTPAPSKNSLKKAAKAERLAALKLERRAREKEAKKAKRAERAAKRAAGELDSVDEAVEEAARRTKRARTSGPKEWFGARVVVDLGFDEKMTEKEVNSLTAQLSYVYAANRRAEKAFKTILFTGLNGRTKDRLDATNSVAYKRWANCEWWEEGYEYLWRDDAGARAASEGGHQDGGSKSKVTEQDQTQEDQDSSAHAEIASEPIPTSSTAQENVVYLTADTDQELTELLPTETYILGGIVDRNRYKNLCLDKAKETGVRTARLPIGEYMAELQTRKVLTVNQVFEILLKWVETRDWEQALRAVMPRRKLPTAPTEGKEDEPERVALLVSGDGGIDMAVEPAAEDKTELEEDRKEEGGEERVKDPAIQLPTVNVVESSIEIDNIRR